MATAAMAHRPSSGQQQQQQLNNNAPELAAENRRLREELALSQNWVERHTRQIEQLLRLSPADMAQMASRMGDPELAIPLLQCYDDTIRQNEEEIGRLRHANQDLRRRLGTSEAGGQEGFDAARLAEETAAAMLQNAKAEIANFRANADRLEVANASLKERLAAMADTESRLKASAAKDVREMEALNDKITELTRSLNKANTALDDANRLLRQKTADESSDKNSSEAQKIQLHLMAKENEDKVVEIDRLRSKMVAALKTAAENHSTHMKIVEEKHKAAVNGLREELRTHEVTILKLRAQLSRADVLRGGGGGGYADGLFGLGGGGGPSSPTGVGGGGDGAPSAYRPLTTTQTMQQHALEMQEIDLKRLHSEVSSLTAQRDDALFRVERLTAARREAADEHSRALQRDMAALTARCGGLEERNTKLGAELEAEREARRAAADAARAAQREVQRLTDEVESLQKGLHSAKMALGAAEERLKTLQRDHTAELSEAEARVRVAERRAEEAAKDSAAARDRLLVQLSDTERSVEDARNLLRDTVAKHNALSLQFNDKQRALEAAALGKEQLTQSLFQHKGLIAAADERLAAFIAQEGVLKQDLKEMAMEVERLRLEHIRVTGERDRALKELSTLRKFRF